MLLYFRKLIGPIHASVLAVLVIFLVAAFLNQCLEWYLDIIKRIVEKHFGIEMLIFYMLIYSYNLF